MNGAALILAVVLTTEPGRWPETECLGQERYTQLLGDMRKKHSFLQSWAAAITVHFQLPTKKGGD